MSSLSPLYGQTESQLTFKHRLTLHVWFPCVGDVLCYVTSA